MDESNGSENRGGGRFAFDLDVPLERYYESSSDPMIKENALQRLKLLKAQEDCMRLDALADQYAKRNGRRPARMTDLVQAGLLRGVPADPEGFAYVFGEDGKAELNLDSPSWSNRCSSSALTSYSP